MLGLSRCCPAGGARSGWRSLRRVLAGANGDGFQAASATKPTLCPRTPTEGQGDVGTDVDGRIRGAPILGAPILGAPILGAPILGARILGARILGARILGASCSCCRRGGGRATTRRSAGAVDAASAGSWSAMVQDSR